MLIFIRNGNNLPCFKHNLEALAKIYEFIQTDFLFCVEIFYCGRQYFEFHFMLLIIFSVFLNYLTSYQRYLGLNYGNIFLFYFCSLKTFCNFQFYGLYAAYYCFAKWIKKFFGKDISTQIAFMRVLAFLFSRNKTLHTRIFFCFSFALVRSYYCSFYMRSFIFVLSEQR